MRLVWPFSVNFLLFASGACIFPFFVLYYQSIGFTGTQIGLIVGITPLISLVSGPLWTNLADATRGHRLFLSGLILAAAANLFVFPVFRAFIPVFIVAVLYNAFSAPIFSFVDSASMVMLEGERGMYGRIRLGGTIGFGVAALLIGVVVENFGLRWAFWSGASLLLLVFVVAQPLRHQRVRAADAPTGRFTDLLTNRRWLPFLLIAFAGGLATVVSNSYLFPYMQELGLSEGTMGLALTLGTIAEVPVFFFGNRLVKRFKPFGLLVLALILSGARLALFFVSAAPSFVLFLQFLSGLTFPSMWLAGVAYADELAPPGLSATAQGVFGAFIFGVGSAVGGFTAGPLLTNLGGRGMFLIFGLVVLAIVGLGVLLQKWLVPAPEAVLPVA